MESDRETAQGTVETEPGWRSRNARAVGSEPGWAAWGWFSGSGRSAWLVGALLVLVGLGLLIQQIQPAISLTSLLLLALGIALGAVWLVGGVRAAFVPAALLLSLAVARLVVELGLVSGGGWTALFLGLGLGAIWAVGRWQRAKREWALWLGLILAFIGLAQIALREVGIQDLGLLWPALIIVIGGALLLRSRTGVSRP